MKGENVLIFGGSSGIGEETARQALAAGAEVTIVGRSPGHLEKALARLPGAKGALADARDAGSVAGIFERRVPFGPVVMCVSGGKGAGPFRDLDVEVVRAAFEEKTFAQWTVAQAAARAMKAGSLTFVTAASARSTIRGTAGLAAVNGALEAAVPVLALELAPLRVNAVSPGIIDTPWWEGMPRPQKDAFFQQASETLPAGRIGKPEEIARAIIFLMTTGFVTGSTFVVDGGGHLVMH
jgi:NAD(P)-dependent dehydrogenase (short-subunit alcohol dehydrogenase family)